MNIVSKLIFGLCVSIIFIPLSNASSQTNNTIEEVIIIAGTDQQLPVSGGKSQLNVLTETTDNPGGTSSSLSY